MDLNKRLKRELAQPAQYDPRTSALVGTALDYRIRTYFSDEPYKSRAIQLGLRTLNSLYSVEINGKETRNIWNRTEGAIGEILFESLEQFISDVQPRNGRLDQSMEDRLCRFCVLLAHFDFIYRTGRFSNCPSMDFMMRVGTTEIDLMLSRIEANVVNEVMQLSLLFHNRNTKLIEDCKKAVVGQVLAGSSDLGGADFDLVVDGCLIEIKTRGKSSIETEFLRQLIGYWLLDYDDKFRIRTAAIYLSRQAHMQCFDFKKELLRTRSSIPHMRKRFRNGLRRRRTSAAYLSPVYPIETVSR